MPRNNRYRQNFYNNSNRVNNNQRNYHGTHSYTARNNNNNNDNNNSSQGGSLDHGPHPPLHEAYDLHNTAVCIGQSLESDQYPDVGSYEDQDYHDDKEDGDQEGEEETEDEDEEVEEEEADAEDQTCIICSEDFDEYHHLRLRTVCGHANTCVACIFRTIVLDFQYIAPANLQRYHQCVVITIEPIDSLPLPTNRNGEFLYNCPLRCHDPIPYTTRYYFWGGRALVDIRLAEPGFILPEMNDPMDTTW